MSISRLGTRKYVGQPGFDGNQTDHIINWFFPREGQFDGVDQELLDVLIGITEAGHLAWVCFVPILITKEQQVMLGI